MALSTTTQMGTNNKLDTAHCATPGCSDSAIARCANCAVPFCIAHGQKMDHVESTLSLCVGCLGDLCKRIVASGARATSLEKVVQVLLPWSRGGAAAKEVCATLGAVYAELGQLDQALATWQPLLGDDHQQPLRIRAAQLYLQRASQAIVQRADYSRAAQDVEQAVQLDPSSQNARQIQNMLRNWQALNNIQTGRFTEAAQIWEAEWSTKLAKRPDSFHLMHRLAILYYRSASAREAEGRGDEANELWRLAIAYWAAVLKSPGFWEIWQEMHKVEVGIDLSTHDIKAVAQTTQERLLQDLHQYAMQYSLDNRQVDAERMEELVVLAGLEFAAAEAMRGWQTQHPIPGWLAGLSTGPLLLAIIEKTLVGQPCSRALRQTLAKANQADAEATRRYLSPLGRYHYLIADHRLRQAIEELEKVAAFPEAKALLAKARLLYGKELAQMQEWDQAMEAFAKAHSDGEDLKLHEAIVIEVTLKAADNERKQDEPNYQKVIAIYESGLTLFPNHTQITPNLAVAYRQKCLELHRVEKYDEAAAFIRKALHYDPQEPSIRRDAAIVLFNFALSLNDKELMRAIALLKEASGLHEDQDIRQALVIRLFDAMSNAALTNRRDEAINHAQQMLEHDSNFEAPATVTAAKQRLGVFTYNRAQEYLKSEDFDKALVLAKESLFYDDDQPTRKLLDMILYQKAQKLEKGGNLRGAIDCLKVAQGYLDDDQTCIYLVSLFVKATQPEEAEKILRAAHSRKPSHTDLRDTLHYVLRGRGITLGNASQHDQSLHYLREAQKVLDTADIRDQLGTCLVNRALVKIDRGDRYGAKQDLLEAARYRPNDRELQSLVRQL